MSFILGAVEILKRWNFIKLNLFLMCYTWKDIIKISLWCLRIHFLLTHFPKCEAQLLHNFQFSFSLVPELHLTKTIQNPLVKCTYTISVIMISSFKKEHSIVVVDTLYLFYYATYPTNGGHNFYIQIVRVICRDLYHLWRKEKKEQFTNIVYIWFTGFNKKQVTKK